MSFLTSEEAGLGQPWYDESNVVAGIGGILSMSELTSLKNYHENPPMFPASVGLNGLGVPASDLAPGELESGRTLVDRAQGFGGIYNGQYGKDLFAPPTTPAAPGASRSHVSKMLALPQASRALPVADLVPGELTSARSLTTPSHVSKMLALPQARRALPVRDLVPGELTHASKMASLPQAFGGMGAGSPVPSSDFVRGEITPGSTLVDRAQGFGGIYNGQYGKDLFAPPTTPAAPGASRSHVSKMLALPQASRALPVADLVPGELTSARSLTTPSHVSKMLALPQARRALPVRDLVPGELTSARSLTTPSHVSKMLALPQASRALPVPNSDFVRGEITPGSRLAAQHQGFGSYAVPRSDFAPGELVSGGTLIDHAQGLGSYNGQYGGPVEDRALPASDLIPGELTHADKMISLPQAFGGMDDFIPWQPGSVEPRAEAQGSFLSPAQVPAWNLESGDSLASQPQNFGGLGTGEAVPRDDFVEGEIESSSRMLKHGQRFGGMGGHASQMLNLPQAGGMGAFLPFEAGMPEPKDGAQGAWLSPGQVPAWDLESAGVLTSAPESFSLGGLGASGDNVALPELNIAPICDPKTGTCISYATPQEVKSAIGAKVGGRSALVHAQAQLPAFYSHPSLGPWGVDPRQAYQYWWAQQANMQRAGAEAPIPIWGSPGLVSPTPELPPSPIAQEASYNPYTNAYPVAGTSVERF